MVHEIEAKILNINIAEIEKKLAKIGAKKLGEKFFRSISFDYPGFPMDKEASWVRMRDDGKNITLAYKKRLGAKESGNDDGMEEIEFEVSDFELARQFLLKLGLIEKFSQEKKRITWQKDSITYDIDTWPQLNTYLEVEGDNWENVDKAIIELGFDLKDKKICSATQIYEMNGIRDKDYIKMTFTTVPLK